MNLPSCSFCECPARDHEFLTRWGAYGGCRKCGCPIYAISDMAEGGATRVTAPPNPPSESLGTLHPDHSIVHRAAAGSQGTDAP